MSRRVRFILIAMGVALLAGGSSTSIWLLFSRVSAEPGEKVTARTSGRITPVLRTCSDTQRGELASDWASHAVHAGPISLYPAPMPAPTRIPGRPGYFRPVKVLTVVAPGSEATLLVPDAQRPYVRLAFADERGRFWRPEMRVRDGLVAMTFKTCSEMKYPDDHFGGGFVVSRPMCAELQVQEPGREPRALRVPFGAPC
jgi:hypothetical protein